MANVTFVKYDSVGKKLAPSDVGDTLPVSALALSAVAGNALTDNSGLYAPNISGLSFDSGTGVLTLTLGDATTKTVNLAVVAADKFLQGSSYNATTKELTLTMTDASTYVVDLSDLVKITSSNSSTIDFTGEGTVASPLTGSVKVSSTANNLLTTDANGLFVSGSGLTAAATAPTSSSDGTISTNIVGTNTSVLGTPAGWIEFPIGSGNKIPYYN
jgi:hypothetical protein